MSSINRRIREVRELAEETGVIEPSIELRSKHIQIVGRARLTAATSG